MRRLIILFLLLSLSWGYPFQHYKEWSFYETEHFNIYFNSETEAEAKAAFKIVEPIYKDITESLSYKPADKIELVLTKTSDSVNGYADYFAQTIVLEVAPAPSKTLGPFKKEPLYNLITHELTHIIHLSKNNATPMVYSLMRRLTSKGVFYPLYLVEGLAVYHEKAVAEGGRLNNSSFEEYIMAFAKAKDFPNINQIGSSGMLRWPRGNGAYILGAKFVDYLSKRWGTERLYLSFELFTQENYLLGYSDAFKKTLGVSLEKAYDEFIDYSLFIYLSRKNEESAYEIITNLDGELTGITVISENKIAYYANNGRSAPSIRALDLKNMKEEVLYEHDYLEGKYIKIKEDIYFLRYERRDIYETGIGLYKYNLTTPKVVLLQDRVADFDTDGSEIYVVKENKELLLISGESTQRLITADFIAEVAVNWEAGKDIYFFKRDRGFVGMCRYEASEGKQWQLLSGNVRDISIVENQLYYVNDNDGFSNLYSMDILTSRSRKLTNIMTGVYSPVVLHNKIFFSTLTSKGYALCQAEITDNVELQSFASFVVTMNSLQSTINIETIGSKGDPSENRVLAKSISVNALNTRTLVVGGAEPRNVTLAIQLEKPKPTNNFSVVLTDKAENYPWSPRQYPMIAQKYNIFNFNLLYFIPFITISNYGSYIGISGMLSDPLKFQQFGINYLSSFGNESYSFKYLNSSFYPFLQLSADKNYEAESVAGVFVMPWAKDNLSQSLSLGMQKTRNSTGIEQYYKISYSVSRASYYPLSFAYEKGFSNVFDYNQKTDDGRSVWINDLSLYLPALTSNHVLKLNAIYGVSQLDKLKAGGYPNYIFARGYSYYENKSGRIAGRLGLEYNYPLLEVDNQLFWQFYLFRIIGTGFIDLADAGDVDIFVNNPYFSYGVLLNMDALYSNVAPVSFGIGLAYNARQETRIIFSFGLSL